MVIHLLGDDDPRVRHVAASAVSRYLSCISAGVFLLSSYCCPPVLMTMNPLFPRLVSRLFYDCDQGQADPVVAIARDQSSVYLQLLMHETQPPSQLTVSTITRCLLFDVLKMSCGSIWINLFPLLFCRTYRGFNLSNIVADVTLENNLSRVITAVSRALTSSTSRAVTVSP